MRKIMTVLAILTLLVTACSAKSGTQEASYGIGRRQYSNNDSW